MSRALTVLGWLAFLAAIALPFLMPAGRVNGLALVSVGLVLAAGFLISLGEADR